MRTTSPQALLVPLVAVTAMAFTLVGPPAYAGHGPVQGSDTGVTSVAGGLDNPRGLAFAPNGALYVAEAGRGGDGPCFSSPDGDRACWGRTGAVTMIWQGSQTRVLTGLASVAKEDGSFATGPSDVSFQGVGEMYLSVGLGTDPQFRDALPEQGRRQNGWLLRSTYPTGVSTPVADLAGYEAAHDPDGKAPNSNPNSVTAFPGGQVVADAGGNSVVRVTADDDVVTLAVLPERTADAPPFLGLPPGSRIPMESVPTSVVRGPDGAFYVGELTGFPFEPGAARVYRVVPGGKPEVFADGFTNIMDIGFSRDGTLYVLELAHNGLLSGDPTGALIRVPRNGPPHVVMSEGLTSPSGLALRDGAAYISDCGVCAGGGRVLRVPLD